MPHFNYTLEQLAIKLNLRRTSKTEYHGPCPSCGGKDRFWIKAGRTKDIVYGCRQCCDSSGIFKYFLANDIVTPDDSYEAPRHQYRIEDVARAKLLIEMTHALLDKENFWAIDAHSLGVLYDLRTKVDHDTRRSIKNVLRRAEEFCFDLKVS